MDLFDDTPVEEASEPHLATRPHDGEAEELNDGEGPARPSIWMSPGRLFKIAFIVVVSVGLVAAVGFFGARYWLRNAAKTSLPQIDGQLAINGLEAPVTVARDAQDVPHIKAASLDDLLVAQGFVTASDRLFQMDLLRRHAAGELAEVLGTSLLSHDRLQRTLQIRASADRALAALPPDQIHLLQKFADGVNASITQQNAHLPIEFRILRYQPTKWTPRDCLLVELSMFQDLTNSYPTKLSREALLARLKPEEEADLATDLYPVGSWRDHPPTMPIPDLSVPGPQIEDIPLDESQTSLEQPRITPPDADSLTASIAAWATYRQGCRECTPGSNNWVVSGAHTASGKPLLSNDMHLTATIPGIWYETDLQAGDLHVAGVTVPGLPLITVGHNDHIAWGFTNLGADVQDVYVETLRGAGSHQEFFATDGTWQPVTHVAETINVHGGKPLGFEVSFTKHGNTLTPLLNPETATGTRRRALSLRWTIYDPAAITVPQLAVNSAHDWQSFLTAFSHFGGPSQNVVYADDQGHIGYHAVGFIPMRGSPVNPASSAAAHLPADIATPVEPQDTDQTPIIAKNPNPLAKTDITAPPAPTVPQLSGPLSAMPIVPTRAREWSGYIPFDQLPQIFDPAGGVIATANSRVSPDDYAYPITLNWAAPYRNDRLWHLLAHRTGMTAADMLPIQMDIYSDFDKVLAERLAYALDNSLAHPDKLLTTAQVARLKQAADLLRTFDGRMRADSPAAAVLASTHEALWPLLLQPHLDIAITQRPRAAKTGTKPVANPQLHPGATPTGESLEHINELYQWGEKDYALEQVLMHQPPRWLPKQYASWNDFLAAVVNRALTLAHAPDDLTKWRYGAIHTLDFEHPIFDQSPALKDVFGLPTGTGVQQLSGDTQTIKQVRHTFGPSERFTADLGNLSASTLNIVAGESGNPMSPWFLDQFPAWYHGTTFVLPYGDAAVSSAAKHTLTLTPAR